MGEYPEQLPFSTLYGLYIYHRRWRSSFLWCWSKKQCWRSFFFCHLDILLLLYTRSRNTFSIGNPEQLQLPFATLFRLYIYHRRWRSSFLWCWRKKQCWRSFFFCHLDKLLFQVTRTLYTFSIGGFFSYVALVRRIPGTL